MSDDKKAEYIKATFTKLELALDKIQDLVSEGSSLEKCINDIGGDSSYLADIRDRIYELQNLNSEAHMASIIPYENKKTLG